MWYISNKVTGHVLYTHVRDNYMKKLIIIFTTTILLQGCSNINGEVTLVSENSNSGFNFPYYLFIPEEAKQNKSVFLIVEPNNTGFTSDDFTDHQDQAENLATNDHNLGNFLAHELGYPLLIPVFPRGKENWKIYTHALDRDAMRQKGNSIERIDLQLLAMADNAKKKLVSMGFSIEEKIVLTGFSASGTFANRFTSIHPNEVSVCIAGGLNGLLILPTNSINNTTLNYPLGINDFFEITGNDFDSVAFRNTPQFLFMGELDDNDAAKYGDAYDDDEREIIYNIIGKSMQPDRWTKSVDEYKKFGVNAELKTYRNIGHEPSEVIKKDILTFLRDNLKK